MKRGGRKLFLSFLEFLFRYIFETELHLFIIFQQNLGPSTILNLGLFFYDIS